MSALAPPLPVAANPTRSARSRLALAADAVALLTIGWALLYLARHDGGVEVRHLGRAVWPMLVALPVAAAEFRHLPRRAGTLVALFAAAVLMAVVVGPNRADFVHPALTYGAMAVAGLLTARLARRPRGAAAVVAICAAALTLAWLQGLLVWTGGDPGDAVIDRWLAVPWHNQSATLMATGVVVMTAIALTAPWRWALAAAGGAGAFTAATWLAGSRGGMIALAGGAMTVAVVTRLRRPWVWGLAIVATAVALLVLSPEGRGAVASPVASNTLDAGESSAARLDHMRVAVALFAERPLTGWGVGGYRLAAPRHAGPEVGLTSHAHNEYVEWFAEGGLPLGLSGFALVAGSLIAGIRLLRRPGKRSRSPLVVTMAGTGAVLGVHAAIDFDWLFPLLALLLAMAAATVHRRAGSTGRRRATPLAIIPVAALLAVALWGAMTEAAAANRMEPAPWNVVAARTLAKGQLDEGRHEAAAAIVADALRWNPEDRVLETLATVAEYQAGRATAQDVVAVLAGDRIHFVAHEYAADALYRGGDLVAAAAVASDARSAYDDYPAWDLDAMRQRTERLLGAIEAAAAQ